MLWCVVLSTGTGGWWAVVGRCVVGSTGGCVVWPGDVVWWSMVLCSGMGRGGVEFIAAGCVLVWCGVV